MIATGLRRQPADRAPELTHHHHKRFIQQPAGFQIAEQGGQASYLSQPSPNPAAGFTLVSYYLSRPSSDVRIVLSNMVGAAVREFAMNGSRSSFLLNLNGLRPGIYFYSLVADGQVVYTRKLMVAERN
jgi:hypothetical protein